MCGFNYDLLCALSHDICTTRLSNTTNVIGNPWTGLKSDGVTKMIVTLLFNDGFLKFKNPFKADGIFFGN